MVKSPEFFKIRPRDPVTLILVGCFGLNPFAAVCFAQAKGNVDEASSQNPIAVPGLEPAETPSGPRKKISYSSWEEIPPINYINPDVPMARWPQIAGRYTEQLAPDTCDLERRAQLAVNHLTEWTCQQADYEIYYGHQFNQIPPRAPLNEGSGQLWPKYMEALPLMRMMSGSRQNLHVDQAWAKVIQRSIGPDGLYYLPLVGRPWDPRGAFGTPDGGDHRCAVHVHAGRMLGVLALYYEISKDRTWLDLGRRMTDRLNELAVRIGDKAVFLETYYFPGYTLPEDAREQATEIFNSGAFPHWGKILYQTWVVTGLSQFYRSSEYAPARELAVGLARALRLLYPEDGSWYGHHHCGTLAIQAFCEVAEATGDRDWAAFARKSYEWARSSPEMGAIPSMGYFPVMQAKNRTRKEPMEPCSIADMTAIAVKLTRLGMGDYYDDIDSYVRNGLAESQFISAACTTDFVHKLQTGTAAGDSFWQPTRPQPAPVEYNYLTEGLAEGLVGFFSSTVWPNELHHSEWNDLCCMGNCSRALYYAWSSILTHDNNILQVHLLLNRTSPWADIHSELPNRGRVEIRIKQAVDLQVRIADWIDRRQLRCYIDNTAVPVQWTGRYLSAGRVKPSQAVRIEFPVNEERHKVRTFDLEYDVVFRGSDVVDIEPPGGNISLYRREHYRSDQPGYAKVQRFNADQTVVW